MATATMTAVTPSLTATRTLVLTGGGALDKSIEKLLAVLTELLPIFFGVDPLLDCSTVRSTVSDARGEAVELYEEFRRPALELRFERLELRRGLGGGFGSTPKMYSTVEKSGL